MSSSLRVAILGASSNPSRYAYLAAQRLLERGHRVVGLNPNLPELEGVQVVAEVAQLPAEIHTLTVYVGPQKSAALADSIVQYGFVRVIFNPGAENPRLAQRLREAGVKVSYACTLVMLSTGYF